MKKTISLLLALFVLCSFLYGCEKENVTSISFGKYYLQNCTEQVMTPYVFLYDRNEFTFVHSAISSYIPHGTYDVKDSLLILNGDDGNTFQFYIDGTNLIYIADKSSHIIEYDNFPATVDGSIFTLEE